MFVSEHGAAATEDAQMQLRTAKCDMTHEQELYKIDRMLSDENRRRLRVHLLLAEHDRDDLRSQLEDATAESEGAESMRSAASVQMNDIQNDMAQLQSVLRTRLRDIERLEAEAESYNRLSQDSAKLKAENLALSREIDQLRSQTASHELVVSEKLALERQVTSLEVDLQNTKRALDRLLLKDKQQTEAENSANVRLEQVNKQYLVEKHERERIEREASAEVQHRRILESKLSKLEAKLEAATERLQQAQDHLQNQLESRVNVQQVPIADEEATKANRSMRFDPNMTIATPGDVKPKNKPQRTSALPGVKSSFSITPFLNRMSRGSAEEDFALEEDSDVLEQEITRPRPRNKEKPSRGRPKRATGSKARSKVKTASSSTQDPADASLGEVPSQSPNQSKDNLDERPLVYADETKSGPRMTKEKSGGARKGAVGSKRDRTLFDDDFDDLGVIRKSTVAQSSSTRGRQSEALRPVRRLGANTTLDMGFSFSPLKQKARAI